MKCKKLTFVSPLNGSVYCEGLVNEDDNRVDFGPYGVLQLYNRDDRVLLTMTEQCSELKNYVPDELLGLVLSAVFGNTLVYKSGLYLATEIWVRQEPTELQLELLRNWITGQLSDGWGERLDQMELFREHIYFTHTVFDEDTIEFTDEEMSYEAHYFLHPWQYGPGWRLELLSSEDAEMNTSEEERLNNLEKTMWEAAETLSTLLTKLNQIVE